MRRRGFFTGLGFNVIVLGIASLLTDVSTEMMLPLFPIFTVQVLGAAPAVLGLIEGLAESAASLLKVFSGWWSDRIGKRKPLILPVRLPTRLGVYRVTGTAGLLSPGEPEQGRRRRNTRAGRQRGIHDVEPSVSSEYQIAITVRK